MKCPQCPEIIYKNELDEHIEEEHSTSKCLFCQIELKNEFLESHVISCGSRTETCGYCSRTVTRLEFQDHIEICVQVFNAQSNSGIQVQNHSSEMVSSPRSNHSKNKLEMPPKVSKVEKRTRPSDNIGESVEENGGRKLRGRKVS